MFNITKESVKYLPWVDDKWQVRLGNIKVITLSPGLDHLVYKTTDYFVIENWKVLSYKKPLTYAYWQG